MAASLPSLNPDTGGPASSSPLNAPQSPIEWLQTIELGYTDANMLDHKPQVVCFGCGATHPKLLKCGRCGVASYCQKDCQVNDWKHGSHKHACASYLRVGPRMVLNKESDKEQVRNEVFGRVRFYACPYAVYKTSVLGRGFLFIQSDSTLATMSLTIPKDSYGRATNTRSLLLHFLTLGEYNVEVCRDDFEMAMVRTKLEEAVENYDEEREVIILMRYRCGHVAVGRSKLVTPDYNLCRRLGQDYYAENNAASLQLNLDDI